MCYFCFDFCSIFIVSISVLQNIGKEMSIFFISFLFFSAKFWNGNVPLGVP